MIVNRQRLLEKAPIVGMAPDKLRSHGVSYGLAEAGFDIRIKQRVTFTTTVAGNPIVEVDDEQGHILETRRGRFTIASAIEEFNMPTDLVGVVHDKSTWARQGLSVFNTVIEPGFKGGLTLELVYHGTEDLVIPAGAGIAQVLFTRIAIPTRYAGKYQGQSTDPVDAIFEG